MNWRKESKIDSYFIQKVDYELILDSKNHESYQPYLTVGEKAIWGASLSSSFVLLAAAPRAIIDAPAAFCCNSPPESRIRLREY